MRALKVFEYMNFTREGTPLEKLDIGRRSKLLKALEFMNTGEQGDQLDEETAKEWITLNTNMADALNYNDKDPNDWKNIWSIETDSYCEEYAPDNVDYEVLENEFIPTSKWIQGKPSSGEYQIRFGTIKGTNYKVIEYSSSGTSGYIARKKWLGIK